MKAIPQEDSRVKGMSMERYLLPDARSQRTFDAQQMASWVNWLAPWEVISHLTFAWECSQDSGRRVFERFMLRHLARVSYFYALEQNPARDGFHVHCLWADCSSVFRREAWAAWFGRYGRARIEPVRSHEDVSDYVSKHVVSSYVTKDPIWWNLKLQWHRIQAMHNAEFKLRDEDVFGAGFIRREVERDLAAAAPTSEFPCPAFSRDQVGWKEARPGLWEPVLNYD